MRSHALVALLAVVPASALAPAPSKLAAEARSPLTAEIPSPLGAAAPHRELSTAVHYQGAGPGSTYGQRNQQSWIGFLAGIALLFIAPMLLVMTELQGVKITRLINRAQVTTHACTPMRHTLPAHARACTRCLCMYRSATRCPCHLNRSRPSPTYRAPTLTRRSTVSWCT